jgi:hypothetical protein
MNDFNVSLQVSALGMSGVFGFMALFYVAVRLIHRMFPADVQHEEK